LTCEQPEPGDGQLQLQERARADGSPEQTAVVVEWLRAVRADVVHVHSLEGFGLT